MLRNKLPKRHVNDDNNFDTRLHLLPLEEFSNLPNYTTEPLLLFSTKEDVNETSFSFGGKALAKFY